MEQNKRDQEKLFGWQTPEEYVAEEILRLHTEVSGDLAIQESETGESVMTTLAL